VSTFPASYRISLVLQPSLRTNILNIRERVYGSFVPFGAGAGQFPISISNVQYPTPASRRRASVHPPPLQFTMHRRCGPHALALADSRQSYCSQPRLALAKRLPRVCLVFTDGTYTKSNVKRMTIFLPFNKEQSAANREGPMPVSTTKHVGRARILSFLSCDVASYGYPGTP